MCWAVIAASCGWMETEGGNSSKRILWRLKRWQVIKASPFHIYSIGAFPKFRLSHNPQCMLPQCSEESWVGGILALASYCCPWAVLMNSGGGWIPTWAAPSYIYRENNGPRTGTLMTINHCEKFSSPNSSSSCPFLLLCLPAFLLMNLSSSFEPHIFLCFFIFLPLSLPVNARTHALGCLKKNTVQSRQVTPFHLPFECLQVCILKTDDKLLR